MKDNVYFVSGIDTNIGKSYATGYLARKWNEAGIRTITQKLVQTGNEDVSEDIALHRRLMGTGWLREDDERLTMPEIFSYPCSPHLAAEIDRRPIDFDKIERATQTLSGRYDAVLLEGAGGLMVPLTRDLLTIDYIARHHYPLVFVTSGRLGSINHLLLSLEAADRRGIRLHTLVYNLFPEEDDALIRQDTEEYIRHLLKEKYPEARLEVVPSLYDRVSYEIMSRRLYLCPGFNKKELLKEIHVPANKFAVLFKVFAGCSFSQYIQNCRLDYAVRLMREQPQWTLDAIAKEAQMSKGAFNIQFHKRYGMKPSEFRSRELSLDEEK